MSVIPIGYLKLYIALLLDYSAELVGEYLHRVEWWSDLGGRVKYVVNITSTSNTLKPWLRTQHPRMSFCVIA